MEKRILHAILISFIATTMVKLAYDVSDMRILIAINIVTLVVALFGYIRSGKFETKQEKEQTELVGNQLKSLSDRIGSLEKGLLEGYEKQNQALMEQLSNSGEIQVRATNEALSSMTGELMRSTEKGMSGMTAQIVRSLEENTTSMTEQLVRASDNGMSKMTEELVRTSEENMSRMAKQLIGTFEKNVTELTEKFVQVNEDSLTKITEKLSELADGNAKISEDFTAKMEQITELSKEWKADYKRNSELLRNAVETKGVLIDETIRSRMGDLTKQLDQMNREKKEVAQQLVDEMNKVPLAIRASDDQRNESLTELSEDVQNVLNKVNRNIDALGERNSSISEDYQSLWKNLSRSLGETAVHNQQFLVLLQDHYKALKEVAAEL